MPSHKHIQDIEITTAEVAKTLYRLNTCMLRSPDNIPAYFLKQVSFTSVNIMTYLFNLTLHQAVISNGRKHAIVTPTYKKGSYDKSTNYNLSHLL